MLLCVHLIQKKNILLCYNKPNPATISQWIRRTITPHITAGRPDADLLDGVDGAPDDLAATEQVPAPATNDLDLVAERAEALDRLLR